MLLQLQKNHKAVRDDVRCHDEWINGNGKEGAKIRIDRLEIAVPRIEKKLDAITKAIWGIFSVVTGGIAIWLLTKVLPAVIEMIGVK